MSEFLQVIGGVAVLIVVSLLIFAGVCDTVSWWRGREMRRWPRPEEWRALDKVAWYYHGEYDDETYRLARMAYRKLRYKYGKKGGVA